MEAEGKDNSLLLLGLELLKNLNKSGKLPYAIVKPRVQVEECRHEVPLKEPQTPVTGNDRKRKLKDEANEAEKKEKRRKMNRIAAQNARDRKKEHMESIEKKLALLEKQNKLLMRENQKLKERTSSLEAEKETLQAKLGNPKEEGQMDGVLECSGSAEGTHSSATAHSDLPDSQFDILDLLDPDMGLISPVDCSNSPELLCTFPDPSPATGGCVPDILSTTDGIDMGSSQPWLGSTPGMNWFDEFVTTDPNPLDVPHPLIPTVTPDPCVSPVNNSGSNDDLDWVLQLATNDPNFNIDNFLSV